MKTIIHVNQRIIRSNSARGTKDPAIIVRTYKGTRNASRVRIDGPSEIVNSYDAPLSCGARVWIETKSPVTILE